MRLIDLLDGEVSGVTYARHDGGADIVGLTCDSRLVEPGFLFAALPGASADGRAYIEEALKRGAVAVLAPPGTRLGDMGKQVSLLTDDNPRRRYALMAARFFDLQPPTVAAVTGTNGKTSVVTFARLIWTRLGRKAASMGTLGMDPPTMEKTSNLTTPDPAELHRNLKYLAESGVECLAMEASSHGLDQHRLDGVRVSVAGFTNLSRDHLDYHGTMEAYLEAKQRLFVEIMGPGGTAVINADSDQFEALSQTAVICRQRVISYGHQGNDIRLRNSTPTPEGQRLSLTVMDRDYDVVLPLAGGFQSENALCALGLVLAGGEEPQDAVAALETLAEVPGRVNRAARLANGAMVYVDYAHTPDALASVLRALRPHAEGRLVVVFGCGGDRDPGKRPEMGRIACGLADSVIVTDDNPRGEDPAEIRGQIVAACPSARDIGDRAKAIRLAIGGLEAGDLLIVAGKGHETGQIAGGKVRPFNDAEVVRAAVEEFER